MFSLLDLFNHNILTWGEEATAYIQKIIRMRCFYRELTFSSFIILDKGFTSTKVRVHLID